MPNATKGNAAGTRHDNPQHTPKIATTPNPTRALTVRSGGAGGGTSGALAAFGDDIGQQA